MNPKLYAAAVLAVLVMAHPRLTFTTGGVSVGLPTLALILAGLVACCLVLAIVITRSLLRFSVASRSRPGEV